MASSDLDAIEADIGARLARGDASGAATIAIRGLGPQILGYLASVLRNDVDAREAFSTFCEDMWRGMGAFRGESTFRTWAYKLAWHAALRFLRDPARRRGRRLETDEAERLADEVCGTTTLRFEARADDALAAIRASLEPEEQTLLVLRVDRGLAWSEIAAVLGDGGDVALSEPALRKRFERLKEKLRREATERGLLGR
jgi:RNA polymerase sigma-70 factor (ECF subfamily)